LELVQYPALRKLLVYAFEFLLFQFVSNTNIQKFLINQQNKN